MSGTTTRTLGMVALQARTLLQDTVQAPTYRYTDQDLCDAVNGAMTEARRIRPDLFLATGLRTPLPLFTTANFTDGTLFPLDEQFFDSFVWYVTGRSELREDTFSDDSRAVTLMNKFTSQLLQVAA